MRAGITPCLDTQKPAAYAAILADASIEYPDDKYAESAAIKASAAPVVSTGGKGEAGRYP